MPECQKIKKVIGLDQYGLKHFDVCPFDTTGLERVNTVAFWLVSELHRLHSIFYSTVSSIQVTGTVCCISIRGVHRGPGGPAPLLNSIWVGSSN